MVSDLGLEEVKVLVPPSSSLSVRMSACDNVCVCVREREEKE